MKGGDNSSGEYFSRDLVDMRTFYFQVGFCYRISDSICSTAFYFRFVGYGGFVNEERANVSFGDDFLASVAEYFQAIFVPRYFRSWYSFKSDVELYLDKGIG